MSQTTELIVKLRQVGGEQLTQLATKLNYLGKQTAATSTNFKDLADELRKTQATSVQSINNLKGYANAWREIANSVDIASKEFKQATAEAAKLDAQVAKAQGRRGVGLRGAAQIAGTAAAGGIFGGPEGFIGGLIGGGVGGVAGAAVGAAIGGQIGMLRQQISGLASYNAEIEKQRIALRLVTQDANSYADALAFIDQRSRALAIPQEQITRLFTQLSASVLGAGGNIRDAQIAFNGIAAGIRGTGGSLQDLEGALRATAQVFSKGKVSAEELRQQIGERLPGAFTLFAQSIGKTPQQLDKALEAGTVSLQDFIAFSEELFKRYGANAEIIAKGPQSAGDRLQAALSRLSESVGRLLAPIGAAFQTVFAGVIEAIDRAAKALARFMGMKFYDPARIEDLKTRIRNETALLQASTGKQLSMRQNAINELRKQLQAEERLRPGGATAGFALPPSRLPSITTGTKGEAAGNKLAQEAQRQYDRILQQLGADLDATAKIKLAKDLYNLQKDIQAALAEGNVSLAESISKRKEIIELENLEEALLVERERLEQIILNGKAKGLDTTKAQNQLQKVNVAFTELQTKQVQNTNEALLDGLKLAQEFNKQFSYEGVSAEGLPTIFNVYTNQIQALNQSLMDLTPRMSALADGLAGSISTAFGDLVFSAQSANESLAVLFKNIAKNFQDMVIQMINDYLKMQIMSFFRNLFAPAPVSFANVGFGTASSAFTNPSFGIAGAGLGAGLSGGAANLAGSGFYSGIRFAMGGIMTDQGPLRLRRYARGGIANSAQLAMFGEGSRPEAYVPLPDGRSIPVTVNGGNGVNVVVNVDATGTQVQGDQSQARALGTAVSAAVQAEIVRQQRPGGLLSGTR